jgi:hypothetical protein
MTTVAVYSYTHSVTYVADNILKSFKDIIRLSGLDPSNLVESWDSKMLCNQGCAIPKAGVFNDQRGEDERDRPNAPSRPGRQAAWLVDVVVGEGEDERNRAAFHQIWTRGPVQFGGGARVHQESAAQLD